MFKKIAMGIALILTFAVAQPTNAQQAMKSGTIEVSGGSIGFLIGFRWGTGTLILNNGKKLKFSFKGIKALETGASKIKATGIVYNMKNPADFEGVYSGVTGALTLGKRLASSVTVKNDRNNVIVVLTPDDTGIKFSPPAPGGVSVSFVN